MKVHYIYKITFLKGNLSGHYYIGKRTANICKKKFEWSGFNTIEEWAKNDPMFDWYTGSGRVPMDYFKKYKKTLNETFNKEILVFSNSFEDNKTNEERIIGDKYKNDPLCVNLVKGGLCEPPRSGEDSYAYKRVLTDEMKKHLSEVNKKRCETYQMPWKGKKKTEEEKRKISERLKEYYKTHQGTQSGKKHTDTVKEMCSKKKKENWSDEEYREKTVSAIREYYEKHPGVNKGKVVSEETKKKLSMRFKGVPNQKNKGENNGMFGKKPANIRKVLQLSKDGKEIKVWDSIHDACTFLKIRDANVVKVCKGERKTCGNYVWKYI